MAETKEIRCVVCGKLLPEGHKAQNIVPEDDGSFTERHFCDEHWGAAVTKLVGRFMDVAERTGVADLLGWKDDEHEEFHAWMSLMIEARQAWKWTNFKFLGSYDFKFAERNLSADFMAAGMDNRPVVTFMVYQGKFVDSGLRDGLRELMKQYRPDSDYNGTDGTSQMAFILPLALIYPEESEGE